MSDRIGDLLLSEGLITREALAEALERQKAEGGKLGYHLVQTGAVNEEDLVHLLSEQYGIPAIDLRSLFPHVDRDLLDLIPEEIAGRYLVFPVHKTGNILTLAMADPTNVVALDDIRFRTGCEVEPVLASEFALREAIEHSYEEKRLDIFETGEADEEFELTGPDEEDVELMADEDEIDASSLENLSADAPVVKIVNRILVDAIHKGVSDIHVETYEKDFRVRFRIDGVLHEYMHPPAKLKDAIVSRIKIMSKLDIAERRLPQDGRIKIKMKLDDRTREMDYRVSCVPTLFGEKVVMRLLDKENLCLDLTKLGFEEKSFEAFERAILKPWGMVLVTGPTGSGKTNTLYSSISRINKPETNIMTAEDPVEFNLHGINQVQTKEQIGLTFAEALRSFLRQDPDIILIGEIRDFETAEISVKAALTGHLVLSTLHTNDAPSTINRLMNMGIEPFLVATSVNLICAQRLVRRVCKDCRQEQQVPEQALIDIGFTPEEAAECTPLKGRGCPTCNNTGYKGRVGLFEVLEVSEEIREMILTGCSALELKRQAVEEGMITLRRSGLAKIAAGMTTIDEVVRETVF
ncbi:MAG TPA: type IV-A pilus assembly ATPase PilB [Acidobacteria bacterium]|nr:type IV-A pilus assembly ATPase PilB [Acidobacteriota bacterium]